MTKSALILGGNGRVGGHIGRELKKRNWHVESFNRDVDDLLDKSEGNDVIVFGWNPRYPDWEKAYRDLTMRVIEAAEHSGAMIFFPGNFYVYATEDSPWDSSTAHNPATSLGRVRRDIEKMLYQSDAKVINLRAGDFIDTTPSGNWFDAVITKRSKKGAFTYPANYDVSHVWAYLPDYARAASELIEKRQNLPKKTEIIFDGFPLTGEELANLVGNALQTPQIRKRMRWSTLQISAPFWPMAKYLLEMRYLWEEPHQVKGESMIAYLPEFEATDMSVAISKAVISES